MSFIRGEDEAELAFRREAMRRLEEARVIWNGFAELRKLRSTVGAEGLPVLEGRIASTDVTVAAIGSVEDGFRTRATAEAKIALRGKVEVAPPGEWSELVAHVKPRHFFEDRELDRMLVVKTSSEGLARTVLDERVLQTVRALAPARLELSYDEGAIGLVWAGVERDHAILDDVFDVLAHLAVRGSEASPYR
jgi:hypothetical protein